MVHHLAAQGHEIHYWTDAPLAYTMESVLKQPATLKSYVFHEGAAALSTTPRRLAPQDVGKIFQEHQRKPYDIIFATATTGIDMGVWLKPVLNLPLVVQWLDVPTWRINPFGPWEIYKESVMPLPLLPTHLFEGYKKEWDYWFSYLNHADAITTLHSVTKNQIIEYAKHDPGNIQVTYHGSVDHETFDHLLKEHVERKNQVICINRIDFHKGVDQTILVCNLIQEMMGDACPEFVFTSTASQPWYDDLIKNLARTYLKKYTFTGWVNNVEKIRLLRQSKVLLDCEWPEGFGGCNIGEAIYCGTQPIAWNRASKAEVYPKGLHLVQKNDYQTMAKIAVEHLTNFKEVNPADKEHVLKYRSIESHAKGVIKVLQQFVK